MKKSKQIFNAVMVMISLVCCLGMFTACKKNKNTPPQIVAITAAMIQLEYDSVEYGRNEKTPSVVLKNGESTIDSSEYSVAYENNIEVGTAKVTVSAKEGSTVVSGSAEKTFEIVVAQIPNIAYLSYAVYNGDSQVPTVSISGLLASDFDVSWEYKELGVSDDEYVELDRNVNNFVEKGDYRVTATGKGNYTGTKTAVYSIYNPFGNVVLETEEVVYVVGNSQPPVASIAGLTEGEDYDISYEYKEIGASDEEYAELDLSENNFVNAGIYRVIAVGKGVYGGEKYAIYTIQPQEIPNPTVPTGVVYDGSVKKPNYQVGSLTENSHYTFTWEYKEIDADESEYVVIDSSEPEFINAGNYRLTVTGFGNYAGTKSVVYTISRADVVATIRKTNYTFNGPKGTLKVTSPVSNDIVSTVYYKAEVQAEIGDINSWTEYSLDVDLNAGIYSLFAKVDAITNYNETTTSIIQFEVYKDELKGIPSNLDKSFTYDGTSKLPEIIVSSKFKTSGLVEGVDYTLHWFRQYGYNQERYFPDPEHPELNFVDYGTYSCHLYGEGNYTNSASGVNYVLYFSINKADMDNFTVSRAGYVYGETPTNFSLSGVNGEKGVSTLGAQIVYKVTQSIASNVWIEVTKDTVLDAGTYYVCATATVIDNENYNFKTSEITLNSQFIVAKANLDQTALTLSMTDNDVATLTVLVGEGVEENVLTNATITYYCYQGDDIDDAIVLEENTVLEAGSYKIYALVSGMTNYNDVALTSSDLVIE